MLLDKEIKEVFELLKSNGFNPNDFYIKDSNSDLDTIAENYFSILKKEKDKVEPIRPYKIYCHTRKVNNIPFIEDNRSQAECHDLTAEEILEYFNNHNNVMHCCYDTIVNTIGKLIYSCDFDYKDFDVIYYRDLKEVHTYYDSRGYVCNWPIGYFYYTVNESKCQE